MSKVFFLIESNRSSLNSFQLTRSYLYLQIGWQYQWVILWWSNNLKNASLQAVYNNSNKINKCIFITLLKKIYTNVIYRSLTKPSIKRCTCVNKRKNSGSRWALENNITGCPDGLSQLETGSYLPNPSARAGYDTRSIFKRSLAGFNSEFSFS